MRFETLAPPLIQPLSEIVKNGKEPEIPTTVFPGLGCGFFTVSLILPSIRRACSVMIAPALCAHNARLMVSHWEQSSMDIENNLIFLLYEEEDIIHGASGKIHSALLDIYRRNTPDALFVVTSCLPEIVGEDIGAVVHDVQKEIPVPVLLVKTENFTDMTARQGQERTLAAMIGLMERCKTKKQKTVNIIGSNAGEFPATELARVLRQAGFGINVVFPSRCDLGLLRTAPAAEFNILINRNSGLLAGLMMQEFQIPYFRFEQAYTPAALHTNYRQLGQFLGTDLVPFVQRDAAKLESALDSARKKLAGQSLILSMSIGRAFDLALLLRQAGLRIDILATNDLTEVDREDARRLLDASESTKVVRNTSWHPVDECLRQLQPDFFLAFNGPDAPFCARYGIRHRNIPMRPAMNGYEAAVRILDTLQRERPGYSTLVLREQMRARVGLS
jgi:nitrogenase molybdenum-cofactor synthesis protein NifE